MDAPLYDVYLTGKLDNDVAPALAAQRLAALFKSTPEAMAGLITGKTQLLKRGVDKNTALKYRDALQNAGCEVVFKAQTTVVTNNNGANDNVANEKPTASGPISAAAAQPIPAATPASATSGPSLQLAPVGENLLRPDERTTATPVAVDISYLSVAPAGPLPHIAAAPTAAPDTSNLSLAAAGGNLLQESERIAVPAIVPDTGDLTVAELGAPIETLKNEAAPLHPDISGLNLAPAGSDLLKAEERKHVQPAAPNTDHITLAP